MHLRWYRKSYSLIHSQHIDHFVLQFSNDNGATWHDVPAYKEMGKKDVKIDAPVMDVPRR
jgi:hypothetical protein